jgi:hypothetical protein
MFLSYPSFVLFFVRHLLTVQAGNSHPLTIRACSIRWVSVRAQFDGCLQLSLTITFPFTATLPRLDRAALLSSVRDGAAGALLLKTLPMATAGGGRFAGLSLFASSTSSKRVRLCHLYERFMRSPSFLPWYVQSRSLSSIVMCLCFPSCAIEPPL